MGWNKELGEFSPTVNCLSILKISGHFVSLFDSTATFSYAEFLYCRHFYNLTQNVLALPLVLPGGYGRVFNAQY